MDFISVLHLNMQSIEPVEWMKFQFFKYLKRLKGYVPSMKISLTLLKNPFLMGCHKFYAPFQIKLNSLAEQGPKQMI